MKGPSKTLAHVFFRPCPDDLPAILTCLGFFVVFRIYTAYFSHFDIGVYSLISVCSYQYAELGLFFTMPFVGIRIILV